MDNSNRQNISNSVVETSETSHRPTSASCFYLHFNQSSINLCFALKQSLSTLSTCTTINTDYTGYPHHLLLFVSCFRHVYLLIKSASLCLNNAHSLTFHVLYDGNCTRFEALEDVSALIQWSSSVLN